MNLPNNMEYKMQVDIYFQNRTNDLKIYFDKFCTPKERGKFPEMLSELYMHIQSNIDKIKIWIDKDELHYYCIKYIYNQRNWNNTDFKKTITIPDFDNTLTNNLEVHNDYFTFEKHCEDEYLYNKKQELLKVALYHLDYWERYVYTEYFIKGKTLRTIGVEVGLSHISIHKIVKKIKSKLQRIIKNNNPN